MKKIFLPLFSLFTICGSMTSANEYNNDYTKPSSETETSNYFDTMSEQDKSDIRFIIMTLATKSQISLLFEKGALNEAGNRVGHVHPLRFLAYIFSDNRLRSAATQIKSVPWNHFARDMADSLADEARHNNIKKEYIADFAKTVGIPQSEIEPLAQNGRWEEFINTVRARAR